MLTEPLHHSLSPVLDMRAAAPLRETLLGLRGQSVDLDASGVSILGGLCLQVILSATQTWAQDGLTLRVVDPSDSFQQAYAFLGQTGPDPFAQPELSV